MPKNLEQRLYVVADVFIRNEESTVPRYELTRRIKMYLRYINYDKQKLKGLTTEEFKEIRADLYQNLMNWYSK